MRKLKGRDLLGITDLTAEEIQFVVNAAKRLKEDRRLGIPHKVLEDKALAGIFETPSTRTSISFESAMTHLGGHMMWLGQDRLWTGDAAEENWFDTIKTVDRYVDGIAYRTINREKLEAAAKFADVPVINASCPVEHPTQALADVQAMQEHQGDLKGKKVAFLWGYRAANPPAGLPNSTMLMGAKLGFDVTIACPEGFDPDMNYKAMADEAAKLTGAKINIVRSYEEAVKDADFINVYSWVSPEVFADSLKTHFKGTPEFIEMKNTLKEKWCVTQDIVDMAKPTCNVMHCLPVARNEEVTSEVLDSAQSIIFDEAENRMHTIEALLALLVGGTV